ncbi:hypothetical protein MBLNU230_g5813t1 [Neophaeotheca triangularis]
MADLARSLREQTMNASYDDEAVTVNTRALIDKVLARYSGEWTTLRELIQNAADAQASTVTIRFETSPSATIPLPSSQKPGERLKHVLLHHTLKTMLVSNNGEAFGENDWQRLKRIAEGNPDETKIGAFGVGFYSVFADCENPFASSGNQSMAFYWKKDSLFTRRSKLEGEKRDTTFLLDSRSQSTPVPNLLSLCQFLATSLTFVGLQRIELWLDDWNVLRLDKKMAPSTNTALPKDVNPKTKDGLMKIVGVDYQNAQVDAKWMNIVGWNRIPAVTPGTSQPPTPAAQEGGLRGWFSKLASSTSTTGVTRKREQQAEDLLQETIRERVLEYSQATAFLRISTVNVQTYVSKTLSAELERATKKPPPKQTKIAILTSSYDETSTSASTLSGITSQKASDIFSSVVPSNKNGKIFIGFPTAQTTGLLAHISAPSVIPTVERESIDLNARYVRDWNVAMLRVAGIACRVAYTGEMTELKVKIERTLAASGNKKPQKEDLAAVMPSAVHTFNQYKYEESTPSSQVGQHIEEAFWTCNEKGTIELLSTRGVLSSQVVRVATEDLSFVEGIPVVPEELMQRSQDFIDRLRGYGILSDITHHDIKKELEAQALSEAQVRELLKWACKKVYQREIDTSGVQWLFSGTVVSIDEEHARTSNAPIISLGDISSFVNVAKIPAELPVPPTTMPFRLTKGINPPQLSGLGWEELQIIPWLRWIIESDGVGFPVGQSLTNSPAVASVVMPVLSKAWDGLSASSKETVANLLVPRTVIPTKLGMKRPPESYFTSVKLFDDLPIITGLNGVKEKFLAPLGVRKTVELSVVFDRLMAKSSASLLDEDDSKGGKWSHVDLIKYLVSVKDDIPADDIKRLRATPICSAETASADDKRKGQLYKPSELYEPNDDLRRLGLPLLEWPGMYRPNSPEGRFLHHLGLKTYPSALDIVDILSKAPTSSLLQRSAINYFVTNHFKNGYNSYPMEQVDKAFLPVQPLPGKNEGDNMIAKPRQCYANPQAAVLNFRILRSDLIDHYKLFGVSLDPPIDVCAERLVKNPPQDAAHAKLLFSYLARRLNEIGPSGNLAEKLGEALIVPIVARPQEMVDSKQPAIRRTSPRACFLGDSNAYGDIFDFVDFGPDANAFLLRVGSKHEPSSPELASMIVRQPARLLETLQAEKYLQLLRKIAENVSIIKRDKALWQELKRTPCLIASQEVGKSALEKNLLDQDDADDFDDEATIKEYSLARAAQIVIVDDFPTYRMFQSQLRAAPMDDALEELYAALETPLLSGLVDDDQRMGAVLADQSSALKLHGLIVERSRLFLHDQPKDNVRHEAKWLESNLQVKATEFLKTTRRLKGYQLQFTEKKTAALHRQSKEEATLWVTARHDFFEVSKALMVLLLRRAKQQDYLALEGLLQSDLKRLKMKGYNVDRILRQKAAESRIAAESARQRQEEQRRIDLENHPQPPPSQAMVSTAAKEAPGAANESNPMMDRMPSMPGAFGDSPDQPKQRNLGGKGLFDSISRQLGFNQNQSGSSNQLTNGKERAPSPPPPYDQNGQRAIEPTPSSQNTDTKQEMSPAQLQRNLEGAIKAARAYNSQSVFNRPETKEIREAPSYCDPRPGHNLQFIADLPVPNGKTGTKLFLDRSIPAPETQNFLRIHQTSLATFSTLLTTLAHIFNLDPTTVSIYHDHSGGSIAFNKAGSLFCNFRFYLQLHGSGGNVSAGDAMLYWYITLCHELAHNLVEEHNSQHGYYCESFAAAYFRGLMDWMVRNGGVGRRVE